MSKVLRLHSVYLKISIDQVQGLTLFGKTKCDSFVVLIIQNYVICTTASRLWTPCSDQIRLLESDLKLS